MFQVFTELQKTELLKKRQKQKQTRGKKNPKDKFLNSVAFCLFH